MRHPNTSELYKMCECFNGRFIRCHGSVSLRSSTGNVRLLSFISTHQVKSRLRRQVTNLRACLGKGILTVHSRITNVRLCCITGYFCSSLKLDERNELKNVIADISPSVPPPCSTMEGAIQSPWRTPFVTISGQVERTQACVCT